MGCALCVPRKVSYFSLSILDNVQNLRPHAEDSLEIDMPAFELKELRMAESTWSMLKSRFNNQVGFEVFRQIFAKCPEVKALFGLQKKDDWTALNDQKMSRHTVIFQDIIELLIVDIAKKSDSLTQSLVTLGAQHWFFSQRGFRPEYWITFGDTLVNLIRALPLNFIQSRIARRAWVKMIVYLLDCVQLGFLRQMNEANQVVIM